jgi:hypothetical protein
MIRGYKRAGLFSTVYLLDEMNLYLTMEDLKRARETNTIDMVVLEASHNLSGAKRFLNSLVNYEVHDGKLGDIYHPVNPFARFVRYLGIQGSILNQFSYMLSGFITKDEYKEYSRSFRR